MSHVHDRALKSKEEIDHELERLAELARNGGPHEKLVEELHRLYQGVGNTILPIPAGLLFARTRLVDIVDLPKTIEGCWFPPKERAYLNRANVEGQPIFYCSRTPSCAISELRPKVGQHFMMSYWQSRAKVLTQSVGMHPGVLSALGCANEDMTESAKYHVEKNLGDLHELDRHMYQRLGELFTRDASGDPLGVYGLSAAITAKLTGGTISGAPGVDLPSTYREFAGIRYPTAQMSGDAENYAFKPSFVRSSMMLLRVDLFRMDALEPGQMRVTFEASAQCHDPSDLVWTPSSHYPKWVANTLNGPIEISRSGGNLGWVDLKGVVAPDQVFHPW